MILEFHTFIFIIGKQGEKQKNVLMTLIIELITSLLVFQK